MELSTRHLQLTEYWIVFTQGHTHWITRWLKRDFSHIYLITRDEYNWLAMNPTRLYLQVFIPPERASHPFPANVIREGDTVLRITFRRRDDTRQFGSVGMLNCVTWARYILGLRLWCVTPYGLYRKLVRLATDRGRMEAHGIVSIERVQG